MEKTFKIKKYSNTHVIVLTKQDMEMLGKEGIFVETFVDLKITKNKHFNTLGQKKLEDD